MADKLPQPGGLAAASFTPVNPAGMSSEDVGSQMQILKDATESLAARYENPNWFNVAAGFFKPQLGGFTASLGSAAQAMGENVEQQRANILPVASMRAELGRLGSVQKQKVTADKLVSDWTSANPDKPVPANIIAQVAKLDPGGPASAAALANNAEITRLTGQISTTAATNATQAAAALEFTPDLFKPINTDPTNPAADPINVEKSRQGLITILKDVPGVDQKTLATMPLAELQDKAYAINNHNIDKSFEDKTVAKTAVSSANSNLDALAEARTIVDKPNIAKLLGTTAGTGVLSAILEYAKTGLPDSGAKLNKAILQAAAGDQNTVDDFQVLTKVMMRNVAATRAAMQNPSVSSTDLAALTNPTPNNTASAIRKIYDLMAHEESAKGREALFAQNYMGKPNELHKDNDWKDLKQALTLERRKVAGDSATPGIPSYYSLYARVADTPAAGAPAAAATPAAGAPAARRTPAASDIAYARAHPETRQRFIAEFGVEP